jgi:hypothetical protein
MPFLPRAITTATETVAFSIDTSKIRAGTPAGADKAGTDRRGIDTDVSGPAESETACLFDGSGDIDCSLGVSTDRRRCGRQRPMDTNATAATATASLRIIPLLC